MKIETHNFEKKELELLMEFIKISGIYYEEKDSFIIVDIDENTLYNILQGK